jgi:2'-5' RNA ligase
MDHLVIPLDPDHIEALEELVERVAAAAGLDHDPNPPNPHVTLMAYTGASPAELSAAIEPVAASTAPFTIHAHGYGFFTGNEPSDLSLHVPVVRCDPLDALHRDLCSVLREAGAEIATWSERELWSPHLTLLDRQLDPGRLGLAASWLAQRHHPSWHIPVDRLALTGGWPERDRCDAVLTLGAPPAPR